MSGPERWLFGGPGEQGSTYNDQQLGNIENLNKLVSGMSGQADITKNQNYQTGQDYLQSMFSDPNFFDKFASPIRRNFNEQTVPDLANRFGGMGSQGSFGSGFRNQLAREGSNLDTNLAALQGGMQQQGANQLLQYAQQPFQNLQSLYSQALQPTQNTQTTATSGFLGPILAALVGGVSGGFGQIAGQQLFNSFNNSGTQNNPGSVGLAANSARAGYPGQ